MVDFFVSMNYATYLIHKLGALLDFSRDEITGDFAYGTLPRFVMDKTERLRAQAKRHLPGLLSKVYSGFYAATAFVADYVGFVVLVGFSTAIALKCLTFFSLL